jgi:hypothetical protein
MGRCRYQTVHVLFEDGIGFQATGRFFDVDDLTRSPVYIYGVCYGTVELRTPLQPAVDIVCSGTVLYLPPRKCYHWLGGAPGCMCVSLALEWSHVACCARFSSVPYPTSEVPGIPFLRWLWLCCDDCEQLKPLEIRLHIEAYALGSSWMLMHVWYVLNLCQLAITFEAFGKAGYQSGKQLLSLMMQCWVMG